MTKSKTILAGLGVVAALGVAALPLTSFATGTQIKGNVALSVHVQDAIAMTIEGNGSSSTVTDTGVSTFTPSDLEALGDYDLDNGTAYNSSSLQTSSSYTDILPSGLVEGGSFKSTITVYTNAAGYTLVVNDGDTDTDLDNGNLDSIPVITAAANGELEAGTAAWGYRVGTSGDWLAMPDSAANGGSIADTNAATAAAGNTSVIEYGVATNAAQKVGTYTDTIVYTATTK